LHREIPGFFNALLIFGTLATLVIQELRHPLRQSRENKLRRDLRNLAIAAASAATVSLMERPVTTPLARAVERQHWGLLKLVRLPVSVELALSVVLLDYTLYVWHYLTHKVPLLWRFHLPHHVDLDMDATTALRFHFGEIMLSVPWRAAQVRLLGISPMGLSLWQTLTIIEIMFHHSNLRLPYALESRLCRLMVTPRMHGIHHSIVRKETDSNWSTIFSWPDYLHRTIRLDVPQSAITIGVAEYQDPSELTLGSVVRLPLTAQHPSGQLQQAARPSLTGADDPRERQAVPEREPQACSTTLAG